jgi:hypothetical protein
MRTLPLLDCYALARLFSSSVIQEIARRGRSPLMKKLISESGLSNSLPDLPTLSAFFDWAFSILRVTENRHEYIYKNAIANKILLGTHSLKTTCMLTEFRAGRCKADVVLFNGTSTVYEIKSERDSLDRLQKQIDEYLGVFDILQVISGENHLTELERSIPSGVGIQVLTERFTIREYRQSVSNIANIRPERVFDSLQRHEYLAILEMNGMVVPELPNTRIHAVAAEMFASLTPEQAHQGMIIILKKTRSPIGLQHFIHSVPCALKAAALAVPLNTRERTRFVEALADKPYRVIGWT